MKRLCTISLSLALMLGVASPTSAASDPFAAQPLDRSAIEETVSAALTTVASNRFVDTRAGGTTFDGLFAGSGRVAGDAEYEVAIAGRGDVPTEAVGVVIGLTAVGPSDPGYFTVYDCDVLPGASALNYTKGADVANEIFAKLSTTGTLCVYTYAETHVLIDLVGYTLAGDDIELLDAARLAESREGAPTVDGLMAGFGRITARSITEVQVAGRGGVPGTGLHAAILNVAAVAPTDDSFLTVYPCSGAVPLASSLNYTAGVDTANELLAELDDGGKICIFADTDIDLIVDVVGYVEVGSDLVGTGPARFADSRPGATTVDGLVEGGGPLAPASTTRIQITGRGGVAGDAIAVVANVAAVDPRAAGFFTVTGCVTPTPVVSSVNFTTGVNRANELVVGLGPSGSLCVFSSAGTDFIVDVVGYQIPEADLVISMTDDVDPVVAGDTVSYTVGVTNDGPADAVDVVVTTSLGAGVTFGSTSGCATGDPNGVPVCALGTIPSGAATSYTVIGTVDSGTVGTFTSTVSVASDTVDPDTGNNTAGEETTSVRPEADLVISMTDDVDPVVAGDTVSYTVGVTNDGPADAVDVVVTTSLGAGVTFGSTSGCATGDPNGVPVCALGTIPSGAATSYTVIGTVDSGTVGTFTSAVSVASDTVDPDTGNNTAGQTTCVISESPTSGGPVIDVWDGNCQRFGHNGVPQRWVNIHGTSSDPDGVDFMSYSLNGGPSMGLRLGPDARRLYGAGDFNVQIDYADLQPGANDLVIRSTDALGETAVETVTVDYVAAPAPSLPYTIEFGSATTVADVVQVVDGPWVLDGGRLKPVVQAYDRMVAIGDMSWRDYEVEVPVTVVGFGTEYQTPESGNQTLVGFGLRWNGHTQEDDEESPYEYWYPTGAFAWYQWFHSPGWKLIGNDGSPKDGSSAAAPGVGETYVFKARVKTVPGGTRYDFKAWEQGTPEPTAWQLTIVEDFGPDRGSLALIAHHMDVEFGTVSVTAPS